MYDGNAQLLVDNELDRYLLNSSMMDHFEYNNDGSLTLHIQKDTTEVELESNWLAALYGSYYTVLRLYGSEESALKGTWTNPLLVKTN